MLGVHDSAPPFVLPDAYTRALREAEEQRKLAAESQRRAAELIREGARALQEAGLTVRDIGAVMGVSYQRASQLVNG